MFLERLPIVLHVHDDVQTDDRVESGVVLWEARQVGHVAVLDLQVPPALAERLQPQQVQRMDV